MHLQRNVLVDIRRGMDLTHFNLVSTSLVRLLVPWHNQVDIDVELYNEQWQVISSRHTMQVHAPS